MKNLLLGAALAAGALTASAQLNGDGYYRIENYVTHRYAYVTDNTGKVNATSTSVDVGALQLWSDFTRAACDPASVLYIEQVDAKTSQYNILAQGANLAKMIDYNPYIKAAPKNRGTYVCYGKKSGLAKYIGDIDLSDDAQGEASADAEGDRREWYILPVGEAKDNYFGIKPTVSAGNRLYATLYASFPYSAVDGNVTFYTISRVDGEYAILKELSGTIPGGTPVIARCSGADGYTNRLNVGGKGASVGANQLGGVYFCNTSNTHKNVTPYKKETMRVLGTDPSGNLAFVTANITNLPANQAYLKVPTSSPATLRVVTEEEYQQLRYEAKGVVLSQANVTKEIGDSFTLTATLTPADAKTTLSWSSSNTSVATVDQKGTVACKGAGTATVTVATDNGLKATCQVDVNPGVTSITISPENAEIEEWESIDFTATVAPASATDKSVTWSSSNTDVATITQSGRAIGLGAGTTTITARSANGVKAMTYLTVRKPVVAATSLTLSQTTIRMTEEETLTLTATVLPENATDKKVYWKSTDSATASVDSDGKVTAVSAGRCAIVASCGELKATCEVTVDRKAIAATAVELSQLSATMVEGETLQLVASVTPEDHTDGSVRWSSSDIKVAIVSSDGLVTARAAGEAQVTATCGNVSATCAITVEKKFVPVQSIEISSTEVTLTEGDVFTLHAAVQPASATNREITWSSDNESVATVEDGVVTTHAPGLAHIYARAEEAVAVCAVTVHEKEIPVVRPTAIELSETNVTLGKGDELQLTATVSPDDATDKSVSWMSSDTQVATVSQTGLVTAIGKGQAFITATTSNGLMAAATIAVVVELEGLTVEPGEYTAIEGTRFDLTAGALPEDADMPELTWSSSNEEVATVDHQGHCEILRDGTAEIRVSGGGFEAVCIVTGLSGVDELLGEQGTAPVYTLKGVLLNPAADAEAIRRLPRGVYLIGGRKVIR